MAPQPHFPSSDPSPNPDTAARWLHAQGLALPAWIALECLRPFAWVLGQGCLLLHPLMDGMGLDAPLARLQRWLAHPEILAALSEALASEQKEP